MSTTKLQYQACTGCGHSNEEHTGINNEEQPQPGNISICVCCGQVNQYDDDMKLQKLSDDEMHDLQTHHPDVLMQVRMIQMAIKQKILQN